MPMRGVLGVANVRRAEVRKTNGRYDDVIVGQCDDAILEYWHQNVQLPYINKDATRADRAWNWPKKWRYYTATGLVLNQWPVCLFVGAQDGSGGVYPFGLILIAQRYRALHDRSLGSSFLWLLATAPDAYYKKIGRAPLSLGQVMVDVGITNSYVNGNMGRVGLHADGKGGARLRGFYSQKCGLLPLRAITWISLLRLNFGGYFYTDDATGLKLSMALDHLR